MRTEAAAPSAITTEQVPGSIVRFVAVAVFHIVNVAVRDSVSVPLPIFSVRVLLLLLENDPADTFLLLKSSVPCVSVNARVLPSVKFFASVTVSLVPTLIVIGRSIAMAESI